MKKQHKIAAIVTLVVIVGAIVISACATAAAAKPKSELEDQVSTGVAGTLVQYAIETEVAVQSVALISEPLVQATAANPTPTPTSTQAPTEPAKPTASATVFKGQATPTAQAAAASGAGPKIIADLNTNCRAGPGTRYTVETYFLKGAESTVEGRDAGKDWWYIVNPVDSSGHCWVWDGSTTVVGDTSTLPVVDAPAASSSKDNQWYYGNCCGYPYKCTGYPNKWWKTSDWWDCYPYGTCTCKPVNNPWYNPWHNPWNNPWYDPWDYPWNQPGCPAVTQINYKKYCKNYPQCCD